MHSRAYASIGGLICIHERICTRTHNVSVYRRLDMHTHAQSSIGGYICTLARVRTHARTHTQACVYSRLVMHTSTHTYTLTQVSTCL